MESNKIDLETAMDDVKDEIIKDAKRNNSSVFCIAAITLVGNEMKKRLIEKLFGGDK